MKSRNTLKRHGAKSAVLLTAFLSPIAFAESTLPTAISSAFTAVDAQISELADLAWPLIIASFSAILLMKLFKRFGNKV